MRGAMVFVLVGTRTMTRTATQSPHRSGFYARLAEVDDAVAERPRLEELEVDTKKGLPPPMATGYEHVVLVDEPVRRERRGELCA
jgi:hypothetical protein